MKSYIERIREEACRERRGHSSEVLPVILLKSGDLEVMVYKSVNGDYIVDDIFCTCKSFTFNLARGLRKPCKHMCAKKRVLRTLHVDKDDLYEIVISILIHGRSNLLRMLEREIGEKGRG